MISSKPDKIGYQMHKLGAIMSVLSENGNVPMPYSLVVIGYSATDGILIPLSKFCFAVAHGREGELYPLAKGASPTRPLSLYKLFCLTACS
jgi:hypothetical protein